MRQAASRDGIYVVPFVLEAEVHWETVYSMKPEFAPQEDSLLAFSNYVREDDDNDECPLQNEDFAAEEQEVE